MITWDSHTMVYELFETSSCATSTTATTSIKWDFLLFSICLLKTKSRRLICDCVVWQDLSIFTVIVISLTFNTEMPCWKFCMAMGTTQLNSKVVCVVICSVACVEPTLLTKSKDWTKYVDSFIAKAKYSGMTFQSFSLLHNTKFCDIFLLMKNTLRETRMTENEPKMFVNVDEPEHCVKHLLFRVEKQNLMTTVFEVKPDLHRNNYPLRDITGLYLFVELTTIWCLDVFQTLSPKLNLEKVVIFSNHHKDMCTYSLKVQPFAANCRDICTQFCGVYAGITYFPGMSHIVFAFTFHCKFHFELNVFFDLVAAGGKVHIVSETHFQTLLKANVIGISLIGTSLMKTRLKEYSHIWHIVVSKVKHVFVRLNSTYPNKNSDNMTVFLHNGPGQLSDKILLTHSGFTTSGFQCVITFLFQTVVTFRPLIKFSSVAKDIAFLQEKTLSVATGEQKPSTLMFRKAMASVEGLNTQIVIKTLNYTGHKMPSCLHGGFAIFDIISANNFKQMTLLCTEKRETQVNLSNIYSSSETVVVTVYSYKHYSVIKVYLKVSHTSCDLILLNACRFNDVYYQTLYLLPPQSVSTIIQVISEKSLESHMLFCEITINFNTQGERPHRQKLALSGFFPTDHDALREREPPPFLVDGSKGNFMHQKKGSEIVLLSNKGSQAMSYDQYKDAFPRLFTPSVFMKQLISLSVPPDFALRHNLTLKKYFSINSDSMLFKFSGGWLDVQISPWQDTVKDAALLFFKERKALHLTWTLWERKQMRNTCWT